jgi:hypothetical protein
MVLTRELNVRINESNFSYFEKYGYDVCLGETIKIPIDLLSHGSQFIIACECDGCGVRKDVIFKNYIKYGNSWGQYFCRKCSEEKRKKTLRDRFGVECPKQIKKKILKYD